MPGREYIPPTDSARDSLIGIAFLCALNALVVGLRLLARYRGAGIGIDDILATIAFIFSASTIGFNAAVFVSGVGHDFDPNDAIYPLLLNNLEFMMKMTFVFTLTYIWALAALKLSQLFLYKRAFSLQLRYWIYLVGAIVLIWGLVFTFVFIFLCDPVSQQWTLQRIGHCMDQITMLKCLIMTNVLTDLMIVILPMWTVWQLQMRMAEKVAVLSCFAIGLACVVIGIVRFWQIYVIDLLGNFTGTSLTTFTLCTVELMLAGICISIPMLRPFYLRWRQTHKSSSSASGGMSGLHSEPVSLKGQHVHPRVGHVIPTGTNDPGNYTAWIELDDKEHDTESNNDQSSERKLTSAKEEDDSNNKNNPAIRVSTKWEVTASRP